MDVPNLANIKTEAQTDLFGSSHTTQKLAVKDRIGFLPISVWRPDWGITKEYKDIIGDTGETRKLVGKKLQLMGSKTQTSIFNPHLAMMILSAYCPQGAKILDVFAGGGTRSYVAGTMGYEYFGIELRAEEVARINKAQAQFAPRVKVVVGDACTYTLPQNHYDFSYSCPPYYDLEQYSNDSRDLSAQGTYGDFMHLLETALANTYGALRPGSLCIWVVGNFRDKHGALQHFNGDTIRAAKNVGFQLWDELVWWGASGAAHQRAGQFVANRKSVRVHEYVLVFKKPLTLGL